MTYNLNIYHIFLLYVHTSCACTCVDALSAAGLSAKLMMLRKGVAVFMACVQNITHRQSIP